MCAPEENVKMAPSSEEMKSRQVLKRGTRYGAASLALLCIASSLAMPHQQSQRDELGCDSLCLGSLTSARSTLTLIGATLVGKLSDIPALDRYGGARRLCLAVGVAATAVSLILANRAQSVSDLWWSIVPYAFQQNMSILKALFSEYHEGVPGGTSSGERASSAGVLGMAAGLAWMIGPVAGVSLLKDYNQATNLGLFFLVLAGILVFLLPSAPPKQPERKLLRKKSSILSFLDVPSARSPAAVFLLTTRLLSTLSLHIYHTIWIVSLRERFQFGPQDYGRFFSMLGLFLALSQGFLAKFVLHRFGGETPQGRVRLLAICSLIIGLFRYLAFQTSSLVVVYILFATMVSCQGIIATVFTADTTQIADRKEVGSFFGILAAVESGAGMAGPLLGGALAYVHPTAAPLIAVVALNGIGLGMVALGYERVVLQHFEDVKEKQS